MRIRLSKMGVQRPARDSRRYSDQELSLILRLASELERTASSGEGHSLAEIQQIAAEAGIDPGLVLQAAAVLDARRARGAGLLGAPTTYRIQTSVAGELPESELGEVISTIRRLTGSEGEVGRVLDSVEWRQADPVGATRHVAITPRHGRTTIEVTGRYGDSAGWLYMGSAIVATIVSVVAATEIHAALPLELGVIAGLPAYVGARGIWQRLASGSERRLRALADELANQIRYSIRSLPDSSIPDLPDLPPEP